MFDTEAAAETKGGGKTPPYIPWRTHITMLEDFKTNGLPPRIDNSVLRRFSGGVGSQIKSGYRAMGLMDDQARPTPELDAMVKSLGTDAFAGEVRKMITRTYPFLASLDLTTATPSMFADAFKDGTNAKEDVLRKCRTFYLQAAQVAGIEVGKRIATASFPRTRSPSGGGAKRKSKAVKPGADDADEMIILHPAPSDRDPVDVLMSIMDMEAMNDTETEAVWTLVKFLKRPKSKAPASASKAGASS